MELLFFEIIILSVIFEVLVSNFRIVFVEDKEILKEVIIEYKNFFSSIIYLVFDYVISYGFLVFLVEDVIEFCMEIFILRDVLEKLLVFFISYVKVILEIFDEIFEDVLDCKGFVEMVDDVC